MVRPTRVSEPPWCAMCTGVIVISETITTCEVSSATRAVRARRSARSSATIARKRAARPARTSARGLQPTGTLPTGAFGPPTTRACSLSSAASRPARTCSGSGRSSTSTRVPASREATAAMRNAAAKTDRPVTAPSASPGTPRFGPSTLPIAPIHTTRESERARVEGAARSVAAKRDCRLAAVPAPVIRSPRNSGTTSSHCAAATSSAAPAAATHQPVVSAMRRPRRAARSPNGIPSSAAPRVEEVRARPAQASLSATSPASRIPIEGVTPRAMVPRICASTSTTRVRRCCGSWGTAAVPRDPSAADALAMLSPAEP